MKLVEFAVATRLAGYAEGPVFLQSGGVAFVQIDRGVVSRLDEDVVTLADLGGGPNGAVEAADGRLLIAQNGGARPGSPRAGVAAGIQVVGQDGGVSTLTTDMTSPNDLAIGPDGHLYVTDPVRKPERDEGRILRVDLATGRTTVLAEVDWYPNGIGFSSDDTLLYVADTRHGRIVTYDLSDGGLSHERTFAQMPRCVPDGFAFDVEGNLLVAGLGLDVCPSELQVWSPDGGLSAVLSPPVPSTHLTNVAIDPGGRMVVTDSSHGQILTAQWPSAGLALHPFRDASG